MDLQFGAPLFNLSGIIGVIVSDVIKYSLVGLPETSPNSKHEVLDLICRLGKMLLAMSS